MARPVLRLEALTSSTLVSSSSAVTLVSATSADDPAAVYAGFDGRASANGKYVVFRSQDPHLDPDHTLGFDNSVPEDASYLYLRNVVAGTTTRLDVSPSTDYAFDGVPESYDYDITADGQYVVFVVSVDEPVNGNHVGQALYAWNTSTRDLTQVSEPFTADGTPQSVWGPGVVLARAADQVVWSGWHDDPSTGWAFNTWAADLATGQQRPLLSTTSGQPCDPTLCGARVDSVSADGTTGFLWTYPGSDLNVDGPASSGSQYAFLDLTDGSLTEILTPAGQPAPVYATLGSDEMSAHGRYFVFQGERSSWGGDGGSEAYYRFDRADGSVAWLMSTGKAGLRSVSDDSKTLLLDVWQANGTPPVLGELDTGSGSFMPVGYQIDGEPPVYDVGNGATMTGDGGYVVFNALDSDYGYNVADKFETYMQNMPGSGATGLLANAGDNQVALRWRNPANASKTVVRRSATSRPPRCGHCGVGVFRGLTRHVTAGNLANGHRYGFAVFTKRPDGSLLSRKVIAATPHHAWATTIQTPRRLDIRYGDPVRLGGSLLRSSPLVSIAKGKVQLLAERAGSGAWRRVASRRTDVFGDFAFWRTVPANTDYLLAFHGNATYQSVTSRRILVRVHPLLTATPSSTSVTAGEAVVVRGAVTPASLAGETLLFQRHTSDGWRSMTSTPIRSDGTYRLSAVPPKSGAYRVRFPTTSRYAGTAVRLRLSVG